MAYLTTINRQWIDDIKYTLYVAKDAYIQGNIGALERANDDLIITLSINKEITNEINLSIGMINEKYDKMASEIEKKMVDANAFDKKRYQMMKEELPLKRAAEVYLTLKRIVYKHIILQNKILFGTS